MLPRHDAKMATAPIMTAARLDREATAQPREEATARCGSSVCREDPYGGEGEGDGSAAPAPSEPTPTDGTGMPMDNMPNADDVLPPMYSAGHEWISFLLMTVGACRFIHAS